MSLMGIEWMMTPRADTTTATTTVSSQWTALAVRLACVELRMALDEQTMEDILPKTSLLLSCYAIVEVAVSSAAEVLECDGEKGVWAREVIKVARDALCDAMTCVLEFLKQLKVWTCGK